MKRAFFDFYSSIIQFSVGRVLQKIKIMSEEKQVFKFAGGSHAYLHEASLLNVNNPTTSFGNVIGDLKQRPASFDWLSHIFPQTETRQYLDK